MRRACPALLLLVVLAACKDDPDARSTAGESRVAAEAARDVDAARAEAGQAATR